MLFALGSLHFVLLMLMWCGATFLLVNQAGELGGIEGLRLLFLENNRSSCLFSMNSASGLSFVGYVFTFVLVS